MKETTTSEEVYGGQLADWVAAFAAGRYQDFEDALDPTCTPHDVKRFLINSFGNRYTWLIQETESLARAFDDFPALVQSYIRAVPQAPYDITGAADEERFMVWLTQLPTLTPAQRDFVTCQRCEYAVETEARRNRLAHVRFQELCKHAGERVPQFGMDARMRIHLNPIRFTGELLTSVLAPGVQSLPVEILFYAAGTSVRAAVLEEATANALHVLAARGPCTLEEWVAGSLATCPTANPVDFLRLAGQLAAQGLVAFE